MAAGEAKRTHLKTGKPVAICDRRGMPQWFPVWDGIPYIAKQRSAGTVTIVNGSGVRPYIVFKTPKAWKWQPYRPEPADYVVTPEEQRYAQPYRGMVMLEPNVKAQQHANKAWPFERWQALADELRARRIMVVQCVPTGAKLLCGVMGVETSEIRRAIGILASAKLFIGTEGALHHAAAAVRTPAIVLWSEFIDPSVTGYASQTNLRNADKPCGARLPCKGCEASMRAISVEQVLAACTLRLTEDATA